MTPDEFIDEMTKKWDAMNEKDFNPGLIDIYLETLDAKKPVATDLDIDTSLAAFRDKHSQIKPAIKRTGSDSRTVTTNAVAAN